MLLRKRFLLGMDWLLLVACMATIYYFSDQPHPNVPGVDVGLIRKSMHVGEYVLLFALWWRAFAHTFALDTRITMRLALLATYAYAAGDELHQHFVGRDGNVVDVLIDGALPFAFWLFTGVRRTKAHRRRPLAIRTEADR